MIPVEVVQQVLELGVDALAGRVPSAVDGAKRLLRIGLTMVPVDDLRRYLDEEDAARIDRQVDAVVEFKFGAPPPDEDDDGT